MTNVAIDTWLAAHYGIDVDNIPRNLPQTLPRKLYERLKKLRNE